VPAIGEWLRKPENSALFLDTWRTNWPGLRGACGTPGRERGKERGMERERERERKTKRREREREREERKIKSENERERE